MQQKNRSSSKKTRRKDYLLFAVGVDHHVSCRQDTSDGRTSNDDDARNGICQAACDGSADAEAGERNVA